MTTLDNEIKQKLSNKYYCEKCDYGTCRKNNMNTHLLSAKHQKTTNDNIFSAKNNDNSAILSKYCCSICDTKYNDRAGLWRHKKKCIKINDNSNDSLDESEENNDDTKESKSKKTDRKSTRLNSSHITISYAVFCLKKKTYQQNSTPNPN